jgi:shikimate kinase
VAPERKQFNRHCRQDAILMTRHHDQSIYLIGYRGSGKTTVARELAGRLGFDCVDADDEIEQRAGKSIAHIFSEEGEGRFREIESDVVADLCRLRRTVVAMGGGAMMNETNRTEVRLAGTVIWLTASVPTILARLAADASTESRRPNLTASGGLSEIETVLAMREPIYRACATIEIDTDGKSPQEVVEEIMALLG